MDQVKLESTSAGGYYVHHRGKIVGHVGRNGRKWSARSAEGDDCGEHYPSRQAAVKALVS